ncbi:hypothetical protein LY13_002792 [Prauserella aidingensis]|uniref:hypothetical protein n=1 Tax=Prauserella aidingensis TaxID=387890 RepID=UPI0020A40152|nr:hypothetical protein [Prauserella aidingensis]MCP2254028.1 hypothetical protein [Prauserella aidingensis]
MWNSLASRLWRAAYLRAVSSAFATVPLYRETWALHGRTDPVLVPDRTGSNGGALAADTVQRRLVDTAPLAGGSTEPDPARGLAGLLTHATQRRSHRLVVVVDAAVTRPPTGLPSGSRGCVLHPDAATPLDDGPVLREIVDTLRRGERVLAVGEDKNLDALSAALRSAEPPTELPPPDRVPHHRIDSLTGGPFGLLHDPLLGYLGVLRDCGRWHVDCRHVYVRETTGGLAFTVLDRTSPRLVDVLVGGGVPGEVQACPRHGSPVIET